MGDAQKFEMQVLQELGVLLQQLSELQRCHAEKNVFGGDHPLRECRPQPQTKGRSRA